MPFKMGDHEFIEPGQLAPLDRVDQQPRAPIQGAVPPDHLADVLQEADPNGPARLLLDGRFCGHGEPTYGVFDVAGSQTGLELWWGEAESTARVMAREPGAEWFELFDSSRHPQGSPTERQADLGSPEPMASPQGATKFQISVGFEYPVECTSQDDVSWIAIIVEAIGEDFCEMIFDWELQ